MKYAAVLVENEIEQSFSNGEHSPRTTVFVEKLYYFDLLEKFLPVFPHKREVPLVNTGNYFSSNRDIWHYVLKKFGKIFVR